MLKRYYPACELPNRFHAAGNYFSNLRMKTAGAWRTEAVTLHAVLFSRHKVRKLYYTGQNNAKVASIIGTHLPCPSMQESGERRKKRSSCS